MITVMRASKFRGTVRKGVLVGLALTIGAPSAATSVDRRSHELVRRKCSAVIDTEDVTLFANGTVRLISIRNEERSVELAELNPDEVEGFLQRVREVDLSEEDPYVEGMQGDWVEHCEIYLDVANGESIRYRYGRYDSLSLALSRVNRVANDLLQLVQDRAPTFGLPIDYVPQAGDILERVDGVLFRVIGLTGDKKGIELVGEEQPLTIFVLHEALRNQFKALVERRDFP